MQSLTQQAALAVNWRAISVFSKFVFQGISTIWLTRMLSVEAFGIYAGIWVYVALVHLVADLGLSSALIQKRQVTPEETSAAVRFTFLFGGGLSLLALGIGYAICSPRNFQVLLITAPTIALAGVTSTSSAALSRALDFRRVMWVDVAGILAGPCLTAIALGLWGFEATALAGGVLVQSLLRAALFLRLSGVPLWAGTRRDLRTLLHFGKPMTIARLANYCAINGDYLVINHRLGSYFLGIYTRAYTLMSLPIMETTSILSTVLFPAYSRLQDDTVRLKAAFLRAVKLVAFVMIPLSFGMAISAPELVLCLFGPKWALAAPPFAILCCGGWLRAISNLADALARSKGAAKAQSVRHMIYAGLVLSGSYVGCRWGLEGAALGVFFGIIVMAVLMSGLSLRILNGKWQEILQALLPGLSVAIINGIVGWLVLTVLRTTTTPVLLRLVISVAIQAAIMSLIFVKTHRTLLTPHERDIAMGMLQKIMRRRSAFGRGR